MRKRFLAVLMAFCMASTLLSGTAMAAENPSGKIYNTDIYWELDMISGTLKLSGTGSTPYWNYNNNRPWENYVGNIRKIIVEPGITRIRQYAFWLCENLTSVILPDTVETIEGMAFSNCSSLQSIDIPAGVTSLSGSAFNNCFALRSIIVASDNPSYASFGDGALYSKDLSTLIDVPLAISGTFRVPHGVQEIGAAAFSNQKNISTVELPSSITKIGASAFWNSAISSVNIPQNVTEIGESAFEGCRNIKNLKSLQRLKVLANAHLAVAV